VISRDLASETRFSIPDVLVKHDIKSMVNVLIAGENGPFGVLEVDASRHRDFDDDDIAFLRNYANLLATAIERHRSHRALEEATSRQKVLIQELEHRVKNMLGLVQSIARQTTAEHPAATAYRDAFVGRLQALAQAENLVFEDHAQELELQRLVQRSLEPFESHGSGAVTAEGEPLRLPARSGRVVALVLHELGTNATKHGALSAPEGTVRISWQVEDTAEGKQVRLCWIEEGGPAVDPSSRAGFGTRLLTTLAGYELDGEAQLDHRLEGLRYEIVFQVELE
jgi:two-component sensor histidine kinase